MSTSCRRRLLALCLVWIMAAWAVDIPKSDAPPAGVDRLEDPLPAPKTDARGDPLPRGSRLRLGSLTMHHEGHIVSAAFSPDGKTLAMACGGNEGTSIRVWDRSTGKELHQLRDYPGWAEQVAFSPDGTILAAA